MPRVARSSDGGTIDHAIKRGNRRAAIFHKSGGYEAFPRVIEGGGQGRLPVDRFGFCLMPNHFHLVVRPRCDGDLGRWMRRLLTTHTGRHHRHHGTSGQDRGRITSRG